MKKLRYCSGCKKYTMKEKCQKCGSVTRTPHPSKYSVEDRWAKYRRMEKWRE